MFCSSDPNLVILAWTGDKLSRGQAIDYRPHRRTHRQTQPTTIPEGQNWPRVKIETNKDTTNNIGILVVGVYLFHQTIERLLDIPLAGNVSFNSPTFKGHERLIWAAGGGLLLIYKFETAYKYVTASGDDWIFFLWSYMISWIVWCLYFPIFPNVLLYIATTVLETSLILFPQQI